VRRWLRVLRELPSAWPASLDPPSASFDHLDPQTFRHLTSARRLFLECRRQFWGCRRLFWRWIPRSTWSNWRRKIEPYEGTRLQSARSIKGYRRTIDV
jgi:hypothetical protein